MLGAETIVIVIIKHIRKSSTKVYGELEITVSCIELQYGTVQNPSDTYLFMNISNNSSHCVIT